MAEGGPRGEICKACYYFVSDGDGNGFGFCYRYPPKIHNTIIYLKDSNDDAGFPEPISDWSWCGEFLRKSEAS